MRKKIETTKKAVTAPISLYPEQKRFVVRKSLSLGMSASRYFQKLADYDREHNLLGMILQAEAKEAAK